jgi:molybdopterin synthase sulfur carrier subunit
MKIRYFAWMKRMVGTGDEQVDLPAEIRTVGDLVEWLRKRSTGHAEALADGSAFGAAIDRRTVPFDTPLAGAAEVAFFPPFTGG